MSTISGNSGNSSSAPEEPNRIPTENQENSSQEQSVGFTSSGLSVRPATSPNSVVLRNPQEFQAVLVEDAARSALQQGTLVSGLTPSTSAATEAAAMLANVEQGETEVIEGFVQNYQEFMALVVDLEEQFLEVCRELNTYREQQHSSRTSSARRLKRTDRGSTHLDTQYQRLQSSSEELKRKSAHLVSYLADFHKAVMGKPYDEVRGYLGERNEVLLDVLLRLGLEHTDAGEWKISPNGMVLKCHERILHLHACIDAYHVPEDISEKQQSVCQTILNQFMALWDTAVNLLRELIDRMIFFLLWLMKIVRDRLGINKNLSENPYVAVFIQNQERQGSSVSLRSTVSGRGDLGDEEGILRSDASSMNMQSSDGKSRREVPTNKKDRNKKKK